MAATDSLLFPRLEEGNRGCLAGWDLCSRAQAAQSRAKDDPIWPCDPTPFLSLEGQRNLFKGHGLDPTLLFQMRSLCPYLKVLPPVSHRPLERAGESGELPRPSPNLTAVIHSTSPAGVRSGLHSTVWAPPMGRACPDGNR
jgi:hypothetical protein